MFVKSLKRHVILRAAMVALAPFCAAVAFAIPPSAPRDASPFSFEQVQARAAGLATQPYAVAPVRVPEPLRRLTYDEYRKIEYRASEAVWADDKASPFRVQFFHPGFIQLHTVRINEVAGGKARPIPFSSKLFNYRGAEKELLQ